MNENCTASRYEADGWTMPHTFENGVCTWCGRLSDIEDAYCCGGAAGKYAMCVRPEVLPEMEDCPNKACLDGQEQDDDGMSSTCGMCDGIGMIERVG